VADTDRLRYTGGSTIREITAEQFRNAGVEDQDTIRFDRRHREIPVDELTQQAVNLLLKSSPDEFVIVSGK
jgi:hypothetical protein